jgi:UDP-N-acetylglucosamine diphosphorylase/glucosamine-1-phosphate N-acetyltransferase
MRICSFEDSSVSNLAPLSLTRPVFDLRCGTGTLLERQCRHFSAADVGVRVRPALVDLARVAHPGMAINQSERVPTEPTLYVNARWLAPVESRHLPQSGVGLVGDTVAWAVVPPEAVAADPTLVDQPWEYRGQTTSVHPAGGAMVDYLWQLVEQNGAAIRDDFPRFRERPGTTALNGVTILGAPGDIFVDASATVEPQTVLDARDGPVVIDAGAIIQAFSRIAGPSYIGPDSHVLAAKVHGGTTLGKGCRVGGEVEASILHGYVNKYHDGFVGHSYIGAWVNFGAGTQVSDLRNDYAPISVFVGGEKIDTSLIKVGAFLGDFTRTSIGALLNAGTAVGPFGQLLANGGLLPRSVPPFCQVENGRLTERNVLRLLFEAAATAVDRRSREWTEHHGEFYFQLYIQTEEERIRTIRENDQRHMRRVV